MIIVIIMDMGVKESVKVLKGSGEYMTENKRFEMKDPNCWGYPITDNKTGTVYSCDSNIWMKELVGVLNALHDENERLKQRNNFLKEQLDRVCSENEIMGDKLKKIERTL